MAEFNILVPLEIPSDETVLVTTVHFESGKVVGRDKSIFDIETSKTSYSLIAEIAGVVTHKISAGDEVKSGQILGVVLNED